MNLNHFQVGELFPTPVRSTALGSCTLWSRLGGIIAPVITNIHNSSQTLPLLIFGVCGVFASMAAFFLPETAGKNLPETIKDAEQSDDSYTFSDLCKICSKTWWLNNLAYENNL